MSATKPATRSVAKYIEVFYDAVMWGQMQKLPGDWNGLRRRLDVLLQRVRDGERFEANTHTPAWAHRLEHKILIEVLRETLLPSALDHLVEVLRSLRAEPNLGLWVPLDRETMERHSVRQRLVDAAVLAARKQHARKPCHLRILEGLRALEDLHRMRMQLDPGFDVDLLVDEGEHLAEALEALLPPTARRLLGGEVEARFRAHVEGKAIDQLDPARALWHNHLDGVGVWRPVWIELRAHGDRPDRLGTWFVPSVQAVYERMHEQSEVERVQKAAAEKHKQRAAAHKQRRRERKEADQAAQQNRLLKEMEERKQEQERERQAEAEKEQHRIRKQREEEERRQRDEERERLDEGMKAEEEEAAARRERKRQCRSLSTRSEERYWERAGELERRWAEAEWERRCKNRGLLPQDYSDEDRERFIEQIS